jgi:hypothetical protein
MKFRNTYKLRCDIPSYIGPFRTLSTIIKAESWILLSSPGKNAEEDDKPISYAPA